MGFLLVFIVPKFQQIFADMLGGKPLPPLTQGVIMASDLIKSHIFILLGVVAVLVVSLDRATARSPFARILL